MGKNIALVYDADFTLLDGYHPSVVLEEYKININDFWTKVGNTQKLEREKGDNTNVDIIYLAHFMYQIRYGKLKGLRIKDLKELGKEVDNMLYPGLPEFFYKIREKNPEHIISHNIISVGIRDVLLGSIFGKYMNKIFGYTFFDDLTPGDGIDEIKGTTSSLEKFGAIIDISYGGFKRDKYNFEFPIKDMIYFGDGSTDIGAFKFVRRKGGTAICVYDAGKEGAYEKALKLKDEVDYILPADYREGSEIWNIVNNKINS
ncbi:hypothetical protein HYU23_03665 [Candidatus Woesearchaeota archaeon]|nr:hypothetical protein [Candidatus Woesearchaeota archaeon]